MKTGNHMNKGNGMKFGRYKHISENLYRLKLDLQSGNVLNRSVNVSTAGYKRISVADVTLYLHQVLAVARWGEKCVGMTVNHINENKLDNSWDNLELLSSADNIRVRTNKNGGRPKHQIKAMYLDGDFEKTFESINEMCRELNLNRGNVGAALIGKRTHVKRFVFERVVI